MSRAPSTCTLDLQAGTLEYRWDRTHPDPVLVLHGGHMSASQPVGEDPYHSVFAPSRPGYGRTRVDALSPGQFADLIAGVGDRLGIRRFAAVVGISAGGPTAVAFAARHPRRTAKLILQCTPSTLRWPPIRGAHQVGPLVFGPRTGRVTWALSRRSVRHDHGLARAVGGLSTLPGDRVLGQFSAAERNQVRDLFLGMRSGHGFGYDLAAFAPATRARRQAQQTALRCPTLVVATPFDGQVGFEHAVHLRDTIPSARLYRSTAPCHLLWFGHDRDGVTDAVTRFLAE